MPIDSQTGADPLSYIVCATPRSGSTLVGEALTISGVAGRPLEHFLSWLAVSNSTTGNRTADNERTEITSQLREIIGLGSGRDNVFGVKIMWGYLATVVNRLRVISRNAAASEPELLAEFFPNLHYILVTRADKVRQAVSLVKALQSGKWVGIHRRTLECPEKLAALRVERVDDQSIGRIQLMSDSSSSLDSASLRYDYEQISSCCGMIEEHEQAWEGFFRTAGIRPYHVVYEQFVNSYEETTRSILNYLGLPQPGSPFVQHRILQRQSDSTNDEWVSRFLADRRRLTADEL